MENSVVYDRIDELKGLIEGIDSGVEFVIDNAVIDYPDKLYCVKLENGAGSQIVNVAGKGVLIGVLCGGRSQSTTTTVIVDEKTYTFSTSSSSSNTYACLSSKDMAWGTADSNMTGTGNAFSYPVNDNYGRAIPIGEYISREEFMSSVSNVNTKNYSLDKALQFENSLVVTTSRSSGGSSQWAVTSILYGLYD